MNNKWTPAEDSLLRELWELHHDDVPIGNALGRSRLAVKARRKKLGLLHREGQSGLRIRWTDERKAEVKRLWLDGHSASRIARRFGDISRNSVIGVVHRMGLARMGNPPNRPKARASKVTVAKPRLKPVLVRVMPRKEVKDVHPTIRTLQRHQCKYPIEGAGEEMRMCGKPRREDSSYCPGCHAITHQPCPSRKGKGFRLSNWEAA